MSKIMNMKGVERQELDNLSPKEKAVLSFVEHLSEVKSKNSDVMIEWILGLSSDEILEEVRSGDLSEFPVPKGNRFIVFSWVVFDDLTSDPSCSRGSSDIRIFDTDRGLKFIANTGSLAEMEKEWTEALVDIDYPMFVVDKQGFRYENPEFKRFNEK